MTEKKPDIVALVNAANLDNPNGDDVKALREAFTQDRDLWRRMSSYGAIVRSSILLGLGASGEGDRVALEAQADGQRRRLGYREASPLCKILIDHVVTAWLRLSTISLQYDARWGAGVTTEAGDFWERRLSAAQRRYLRAVTALARIRKLESNLPQVQVNIAADGGQQVIAGDVSIERKPS